jgi:hypothetical protein
MTRLRPLVRLLARAFFRLEMLLCRIPGFTGEYSSAHQAPEEAWESPWSSLSSPVATSAC